MKIAVIHNGGSVGGWRWVCAVFGAIKKYYPDTEITVIYQENVALPNDILSVMKELGLNIDNRSNSNRNKFERKKYLGIKLIDNLINHFRKIDFNKKHPENTQTLSDFIDSNFDIAFNSWPYNGESIDLSIPHFFIPHDFIFIHYFGHHVGNIYNRNWYNDVKSSLKKYIEKGYIPCVTTNFIASEFRRTFPEYKGDINQVTILLSNKNQLHISQTEIDSVMKKFGIKDDYIILATNDMHHKNSSQALSAYYYVKQKYPDLKMIIVGYGTEGVRVKVNCPYYADHVEDNEDYDVKSLGLVSDLELNALVKNAKVLLNVSLCEAACGSGLDAWFLGTPTAISDIPPYKEQVETLGVKTEFFNPKNSEDIAAALLRLLDNPEYAKENARQSKEALNTKYTEKDMADGYMNVFNKYLKK